MNKESYSNDFKTSSVKLALETNQPYAQTARELGVKVNTLYTWIDNKQPKNTDERALQKELSALRGEISKLKTERDILKKAAADFARETRLTVRLDKKESTGI